MSYESWLDTYESVYEDPGLLHKAVCPNCGSLALNLRFVVEARDATVGNAAFWCAVCNWGILTSRSHVPVWAKLVVRGEAEHEETRPIPNYNIVPPEPLADDEEKACG